MANPQIHARQTEARPVSSPLGHLNRRFHARLSTARQEALEQIKSGEVPVVLRLDDRLIVAHGAKVTRAAINGAEYHMLKALAHLPVLAHLESVHSPREDPGQFAEVIKDCERFLLDRSIDAAAFSRLVVNVARGTLSDSEHADLAVIQQHLIARAAENEVSRLVGVMHKVERDLAAADCWSQTHFVVCGGNQPRYKHVSKSFFNRLLTEQTGSDEAEIHRVLYSETCDSLDAARDLVANRLVNGDLAQTFMDSPISLDSDVLGDAGLRAIDQVFADSRVANVP